MVQKAIETIEIPQACGELRSAKTKGTSSTAIAQDVDDDAAVNNCVNRVLGPTCERIAVSSGTCSQSSFLYTPDGCLLMPRQVNIPSGADPSAVVPSGDTVSSLGPDQRAGDCRSFTYVGLSLLGLMAVNDSDLGTINA